MNEKEKRAQQYQRNLPEVVWDLLELHGVARRITSWARIGFDGSRITVPISQAEGVTRFEYWEIDEEGSIQLRPESIDRKPLLYGAKDLRGKHFEVTLVQGILECLVARSQGLLAVAASGVGTDFDSVCKLRFSCAKRRSVCFRKGHEKEALKLAGVLGGHVITLPEDCTSLSTFFIDCGQSAGDFRRLSLAAYEARKKRREI